MFISLKDRNRLRYNRNVKSRKRHKEKKLLRGDVIYIKPKTNIRGYNVREYIDGKPFIYDKRSHWFSKKELISNGRTTEKIAIKKALKEENYESIQMDYRKFEEIY